MKDEENKKMLYNNPMNLTETFVMLIAYTMNTSNPSLCSEVSWQVNRALDALQSGVRLKTKDRILLRFFLDFICISVYIFYKYK